jgi:DNA-binding winged helix-turn-helix (wHTH) protein
MKEPMIRVRRRLPTLRGIMEVVEVPEVLLNGASMDLPRLQSRILLALLESSQPVTTPELAMRVWQGQVVSEHTVHSQITILRRRLADLGLQISNTRGRGYTIANASRHDSRPNATPLRTDGF